MAKANKDVRKRAYADVYSNNGKMFVVNPYVGCHYEELYEKVYCGVMNSYWRHEATLKEMQEVYGS